MGLGRCRVSQGTALGALTWADLEPHRGRPASLDGGSLARPRRVAGRGEGGREWRALATTSWVETAAGAVAGTSLGGPVALADEGVSGSFQGGRDPRPTAVMHEAGVLAER